MSREPTADQPDVTATQEAGSAAPTPATSGSGSGARYQPVAFHAKGGLGEVLRATDQELNREVALKRIQPQHAGNGESRRRFLVEAEVTARLEHPGVVPVYGLVQDENGQPCYAMRFIQGETLQDAIKSFHALQGTPAQRNLALRQLLNRLVAVCNTVAYAHSRGIIHRDIKPSNVMLGKFGETLLVDWGLAKPVARKEQDRAAGKATLAPSSPASGSGSEVTAAGIAVGTPAYMSPEQAEGNWDRVGPATDIYSLGSTLYVILAGKPPFEGTDVKTMLERVKRGAFGPPRSQVASVPRALEAICLKAMAEKPKDRYQAASELAGELEAWLADERVTAYREPLGARLGRWTRRHRTLMTGIAALLVTAVVALGIGIVVVKQQETRAVEAQRQAALSAEAARVAEEKARLSGLETVEQRNLAFAALKSVVAGIHREKENNIVAAGADHAKHTEVLRTAVDGLSKLARTTESASEVDLHLAIACLELGDCFATRITQQELDTTPTVADSVRQAQRLYQRAHTAFKKLAADPKNAHVKPDLARAAESLGKVSVGLKDWETARLAYEEAIAAQRDLGPTALEDEREDLLAKHHVELVKVNEALGNAAAAQSHSERAEAICKALLASADVVAALQARVRLDDIYTKRIEHYLAAANPAEAMKAFHLLVDLQPARLSLSDGAQPARLSPSDGADGPEPRHAHLYEWLAAQSLVAKQVPTSIESTRQALILRKELASKKPTDAWIQYQVAKNYESLAGALETQGDKEASRAAYRDTLAAAERAFELKILALDREVAADATVTRTNDFLRLLSRIGIASLDSGDVELFRQVLALSAPVTKELTRSQPVETGLEALDRLFNPWLTASRRSNGIPEAEKRIQRQLRDAYRELLARLPQNEGSTPHERLQVFLSCSALGDAELAMGNQVEARAAYQEVVKRLLPGLAGLSGEGLNETLPLVLELHLKQRRAGADSVVEFVDLCRGQIKRCRPAEQIALLAELAWRLLDGGESAAAKDLLSQAQKLALDASGRGNADPKELPTGQASTVLGHCWRRLRDQANAETCYRLAVRLYEREAATSKEMEARRSAQLALAQGFQDLGLLLRERGWQLEADQAQGEAITILDRAIAENSAEARASELRARSTAYLGKTAVALQEFDSSKNIETTLCSRHEAEGELLGLCATIERADGQPVGKHAERMLEALHAAKRVCTGHFAYDSRLRRMAIDPCYDALRDHPDFQKFRDQAKQDLLKRLLKEKQEKRQQDLPPGAFALPIGR